MARKTTKGARRMKDSMAQKRRKKRLTHFANKAQPMEFCHKSINDGWNLRRTLKQNYEAMGLSTSPMDTLPVKKGDVARKAAQKDREVPLEDTHVIEELTAVQNTPAPAPYQVRSMSINEQKRIQMLLEKHGEDFTAMARDIKINVNQETAAVLRKRVALYQRLQAL